jgi:hypothetical protein
MSAQTESPRALDTNPLRKVFHERLGALKDAAKNWGIQPNHPEGVFISAMIAMQEGFMEVLCDMAEHHDRTLHLTAFEMRELGSSELQRQKLALKETHDALNIAKLASQNLKIEKEGMATKMIEQIVPRLKNALGDAMIIRERRMNRDWMWRRVLGVATLMLTLMIGGYCWGAWSSSDKGGASAYATAVYECQHHPKWHDDQGKPLCELKPLTGP